VTCAAGAGPLAARDDSSRAAALDPQRRLVRVDVRGASDRAVAARLGTLVEDYGSFVVVAVIPDALAAEASGLSWQAVEPGIHVRAVRRDPLREGMPEWSAGAGNYRVVQFIAPVKDAWLEDLRAAGVEFLQYVPHQAFLVHAPGDASRALDLHPKVRWSGPFSAEYKVDPHRIAGGAGVTPPEATPNGNVYDVAVFKRERGGAMAARLREAGARIRREIVLATNYFDIYRVEAAAPSVADLAAIPGVIAVDPWIGPRLEDERANQICAGNYFTPTLLAPPGYDPQAQFGVDGQGVTSAVVDDGVGIPGDGGYYITAANAADGPLRGASAGAQGHGHLNASLIAGAPPFHVPDPAGYDYGAGLAPASHVVNIPFARPGYTGTEADTANDTVTTAGPNGVKGTLSNNGWGAGVNGSAYDSYAALFDGLVRDASSAPAITPLAIVFSAGNSGTSGITRPKVAKNIISTANAESLRTELWFVLDNMDDLLDSSSRGPAADGRVKPDLAAAGGGVTGGRSGPDSLSGNIDFAHRWSSSTSHAAAHVSAAAALVTQFWRSGHGGQNPSPALIKAMLINGAVDMNGVGTTAPIPNGAEGWGRLNLGNVLNTGASMSYLDQATRLRTVGATFTSSGAVADAARTVRITLVWTDPPGVSDPALVNDLDLEVSVGASLYRGNVFSGGLSVAGGSFDTVNNVENVFLAAGTAAGTPVAVTVRAAALNGDGALGNGDLTDQHFALVIHNVTIDGIFADGFE
jgi:hypothetical protein